MGLPQYNMDDVPIKSFYYSGTTALIQYGLLAFARNADPDNAAFRTHAPGRTVTVPDSGATIEEIAGIVHPSCANKVAPTGGAVQIDLICPRIGDVIPIAVAIGIDVNDGVLPTNSEQYGTDSGAWATGDLAYALYDEANSNNPYGTSAIDGSSVGIVDCVWTRGM